MPQNFFARFRGTPFRYAPLRASESNIFSPPYTSLTILGCNILLPLNELEKYVNVNKHLPEIETADEMQKNGINIGETQTKLLQKIEELTLYIIDQNKRIRTLEENYEKSK